MKKLKFRRKNKNVLSVSMSSKKSRERLVRLLVWAVIGCVVIGCGGAIAWKEFVRYALCQNPDFALRNVEVRVNGAISTAQVLRWSGVEKGQNLVAMDLDCVRARLLRIPYINHVSVERRLPDTLRIIVDERQPIALLQPKSRDGYLLAQGVYYTDGNGVIIKPKQGERLKRLPVISGVDSDFFIEGSKIEHPGVLSALSFIRLTAMSPVGLDLDLTKIDVSSDGYLITYTHDGGCIRFRTNFLEQQMQRLKVIFDYARSKQAVVRTADLSPTKNVPVTFFN